MSKIIKLTESDLVRLVKKVIKEQVDNFNVGDNISGLANAGGNRPIGVSFKISKKGPNGLEGALTEWGFSSNWGTKVGDKVIVKNIKGGGDNMSCTLVIPNSKIGEVKVEYCEKNDQDYLGLSSPEQDKMINYVKSQWKNSEYEQNSRNITMSDPKTKRLLDFNYSTRKIVFEKPFGMDPSPISIDVKFPQFKAWFDKNNNINPIAPMMEVRRKKLTNENRRRDENGDLIFEFTNSSVLLRNLDKKKVQYILSKLPETIKFLAIVDCEGADFSDIVICSFPSLYSVNLRGTPNNFEENVECEYEQMSEGLYRIVK